MLRPSPLLRFHPQREFFILHLHIRTRTFWCWSHNNWISPLTTRKPNKLRKFSSLILNCKFSKQPGFFFFRKTTLHGAEDVDARAQKAKEDGKEIAAREKMDDGSMLFLHLRASTHCLANRKKCEIYANAIFFSSEKGIFTDTKEAMSVEKGKKISNFNFILFKDPENESRAQCTCVSVVYSYFVLEEFEECWETPGLTQAGAAVGRKARRLNHNPC